VPALVGIEKNFALKTSVKLDLPPTNNIYYPELL